MATVGAAALALAACGGGEAGSPQETVVAQGLDARFEDGAAWTLSVDGDLDAIAGQLDEPTAPEALFDEESLLGEGLVRGAFGPDGGVAMTVGTDDGFFEVRAVDEALHLRLDLEGLREFSPEASGEVPDPEELLGQLEVLGLPPTLQMTAGALLEGGWIGITGLTQEQIQSFAEDFGRAGLPSGEEATEDVRALLEEEDLLDGGALTDRFLEVEGDGPTYDVTIMAREFFETMNELNAELQDTLGPMGGSADQDLPELEDVPETLSGFTITVEDGQATEITGDVATITESVGEDADGLEEGDVTVRLQLDDLVDQLEVPADATTIAFEELLETVMGAMFGGSLGG